MLLENKDSNFKCGLKMILMGTRITKTDGATGAALLSRFAAIKLAFDFGSKQHRFKKRKTAPVCYERCLMPESKDNQAYEGSQG